MSTTLAPTMTTTTAQPMLWPKQRIIHGVVMTVMAQYRKCGKPVCRTCREGKGHGPYNYGYFRELGKLRSHYIGKVLKDAEEAE